MKKGLGALVFLLGLGSGTVAVAQAPAVADTTKETIAPEAPLADYDTPKRYIVNKVTVTGIKFLDPEVIARSSGIVKGDTIMLPSDYVSSAMRRMWNYHYFSDVRILADPVGDSVNFEIYLQERPRVYKWKIVGATKSETSELLKDKLKLKRGSELSEYVLNTSLDIIKKYYDEKGFQNAEITYRQENDTTIRNAVNLTFVVNRKKKVKIGEITFEGNQVFSDRKLRKTFKKTHQKSINFFRSSKLKRKEYAEDKENLLDFYNSRGYRNAVILSDSIYPISADRIGITIKLDEGNKFYYRNVSWLGNSVYPTKQLDAMVGIVKGSSYDKKSLYKQLGIGKETNPDEMSVSTLYQNSGYLFSQIEPQEVVVGKDSVDLVIKIFEGDQARINEVTFTGNYRVDDKVIRRELYVRPGELYDRSMLMATLRQLGQMQHFDPEKLQPNIMPVSNELVNIAFPLEEKASDKFEISGGWGEGMFVGSVGVQLNNFSIRNLFKKGEWRPYPSGQNQQLAIKGQTNGTYYKALQLSFTEPWLGGRKPNSLTVGLYYSDQSNAYYFTQKATKHFRTLGASVGIGRRLSWPDRYFTLYNEIAYQAYNLKDWDSFIVTNGTSNIIQFKTMFGRSSVDQPIYPRQGSDFSITLSLTPPYSLFDGKDYSDPNMSSNDRYRWIEFHKWLFKGRWYFPLSSNHKLVLMAGAEFGYLGSYNKNKPSPFEGFDVGGDGMTGYSVYGVDIIKLRGYENGGLTPYAVAGNSYARAYNKYTVELRYPILMQSGSTIYALAFAEGGNGFASWQDFNPFSIKRSVGVGIRLYLPVVGLIGFDWGYGFDPQVGEDKAHGGELHFMMGQEF